MNNSGSGVTSYTEFHSDEMRLFKGGLRYGDSQLVINNQMADKRVHDKFSYSRGTIYHSRSPNNQFLAFHYMHGGVRKFFIDRFLYQVLYKRLLRPLWLPATLYFSC